MYKVLIADDEIWVAALIRQSIDWEKHELELVGEVSTGTEAYEKIIELSPHIVITDIRMPELDGISLIEKTRLAGIDCEFIIISGYSDFEYAQSALKFNVVSYILKPVDDDELHAALCSAKERIRNKNHAKALDNRSREQLHELRMTFLQKLLFSEGNGVIESIDEINKKYSFSFIEGLFLVLIQHFPSDSSESLIQSACCSTDDILNNLVNYHYNIPIENDIITVVNLPFSLSDPFKKPLQNLLVHQLAFAKQNETSITIGAGTCTQEFSSIASSYSEAKEMLKYRITNGAGKLYYSQELHNTQPYIKGLSTSQKLKLSTLIETYNSKELNIFISSLIDQIIEINNNKPNALFSLIYQLIDMYIQSISQMGIPTAESFPAKAELAALIDKCDTLDEMKRCIRQNICEPLDKYYKEQLAAQTGLTAQVKIYVYKNYRNNIHIIDVADHLHRNPSYLGFIFKRDTGVTFNEFLSAYRVEIAKNYLTDMKYTVASIAEMVGFSDYRYFSKVFKNLVGVTPLEYRKKTVMAKNEEER